MIDVAKLHMYTVIAVNFWLNRIYMAVSFIAMRKITIFAKILIESLCYQFPIYRSNLVSAFYLTTLPRSLLTVTVMGLSVPMVQENLHF